MSYSRTGLGLSLLSAVKQIKTASSLVKPAGGAAATPNPGAPSSSLVSLPLLGPVRKTKVYIVGGLLGALGLGYYALKKK